MEKKPVIPIVPKDTADTSPPANRNILGKDPVLDTIVLQNRGPMLFGKTRPYIKG